MSLSPADGWHALFDNPDDLEPFLHSIPIVVWHDDGSEVVGLVVQNSQGEPLLPTAASDLPGFIKYEKEEKNE